MANRSRQPIETSRYLNEVVSTGGEEFAFGTRRGQRQTPTQPPTVFNYQHARHPDYIDKSNRLFSFATWRYPRIQDPTHLANYGFFYTGEGDLVRCFFCSIGLKDFISSDEPLIEHIRYSGDCQYLVQLLGPTRLQQIKDSLNTGSGHQDLNQSNTQQTGSAEQSPRHTVPSQSQTSSTKPREVGQPQRHRHPEYSSYSVRLSSFSGWPTHLVQTPQSLAEAGFYYTGTGDVVRCYSCDGGLQKWDPHDDPWIEHCINFPTCTHLKETKGDDYIALAKAHRQQPTLIGTAPPRTQDITTGLNGLHLQEHTHKGPHSDTNKTVIQKVSEMGFELADIHRASESVKRNKKEISVEAIIDEIQSFYKDDTETTKLTPKELFDEHQELLKQLVCMQCKTADNNSLFLPCQHHRFCTTCSETMTTCPLCGSRITQKIKTYRP